MLLLKSGLIAISLVFNKFITTLRTKIFFGRFNTYSLNAFAKVIRSSLKHFVPVNVMHPKQHRKTARYRTDRYIEENVKNNQNIFIAWFVIEPKIHKLLLQYSNEVKDEYN
jgi:hypothetical protein